MRAITSSLGERGEAFRFAGPTSVGSSARITEGAVSRWDRQSSGSLFESICSVAALDMCFSIKECPSTKHPSSYPLASTGSSR